MGRKRCVPGIIFWSRCGGEFKCGHSYIVHIDPEKGPIGRCRCTVYQ